MNEAPSTLSSMRAGARTVSPIIFGIIPFGLVAGASVISAGLGVTEAIAMSLLVNAGAAQIAATALFTEDAPLLVAVGTALVINARLFIYSTSIAPVIVPHAGRWRWLLGHPLVDQSYAVTMLHGRYRDDIRVVPYYVGSWLVLAITWQLSNIAGALGGALVPASWSLDFAVPLVFLAMLMPALKFRADVEAAIATGLTAAILVPHLPMQTGLIAAIVVGMVWGAARHRDDPAEGVDQ